MIDDELQAELQAIVRSLIAGGESYYVEFKTAWEFGPDGKKPRDLKSVAKDIGEAMVAFANSDGGDLLIGVEDSGTITGIPWEGDKFVYLVQAPRQQVGVSFNLGARVHEVAIDGHRVLLFRVSDYPNAVVITADGRCLWRSKDNSEPVPPSEVERRRKHRLGDAAYEAQPMPNATLADIEIPSAIISGRAHLASMTDPAALLRYWNLIEGRNGTTVLRRAALLLFAKEPLRWHANNRLRVRRVQETTEGYGRHLGTQEIEVLGPIPAIIRDAKSRLQKRLAIEARTDDLFTTTQILPPDAVDECIVNAVAHRNYAIEGSAIEVLLFPDRVEFKSPGKLPEPLTITDLRRQQGAHRSRNPLIMRVLRDLGWARDQGEGMRRIFGSMSQVELNDPELDQSADTFIVRLSTRSRYDGETQAWLAAYGPFGLLPQERKYMVALKKSGGKRSVDRLARGLGESFDTTKAQLKSLEQKALIWHGPRSRTFHIVEPLTVPHERAWRRFADEGISLDAETLLEMPTLRRVFRVTDERSTASMIEGLREGGILTPAGKGQWRLGTSILEYSRNRTKAIG